MELGDDDDEVLQVGCRHLRAALRLSNVRKRMPHLDLRTCEECVGSGGGAAASGASARGGKKKKSQRQHGGGSGRKAAAATAAAAGEDVSGGQSPPVAASLWMCLTCAHIGGGECGSEREDQAPAGEESKRLRCGHAAEHQQAKRSHHVVVDPWSATPSSPFFAMWCFSCEKDLVIDQYHLLEALGEDFVALNALLSKYAGVGCDHRHDQRLASVSLTGCSLSINLPCWCVFTLPTLTLATPSPPPPPPACSLASVPAVASAVFVSDWR